MQDTLALSLKSGVGAARSSHLPVGSLFPDLSPWFGTLLARECLCALHLLSGGWVGETSAVRAPFPCPKRTKVSKYLSNALKPFDKVFDCRWLWFFLGTAGEQKRKKWNPHEKYSIAASAYGTGWLLRICRTVFDSPAAQVKISKDLKNVAPTGTVDVIIQYKVPPTAAHFAKVHALGGKDKQKFSKVAGAAFTLSHGSLQTLANDPDVAYISIDRKIHPHLDISAGTVNAPMAWNLKYMGSGIGIAVIDSGIDQKQPDLGIPNGSGGVNRIVYQENFLVPAIGSDGHPNSNRYQTSDGYGHGTHVAGIIAGNGTNSTGSSFITTYKGIAPQANLVDLQVLDANGEGSDSTVIAAIEQAINLKSKYNIRVINLSLGRPVFEGFALDPLCQAVEQAWQAGIVVVVAAGYDGRDNSFGNSGYGTIDAPGNDPFATTVGAMNAKLTPFRGDDVLTTYSSKGPTAVDHIVKPDIMAPGNHISSLLAGGDHIYLPANYPSNIVNPLAYQIQGGQSNYLILNGTSMATGVVSGAVADLLSANPTLTPDQVKAVLMLSASKQFYTYSDTYYQFAALSYASHAQLVRAQQNLLTAQKNIQPDTANIQQTQGQLAKLQSVVQSDTSLYQSALKVANQTASQLAQQQTQAAPVLQANILAQQQLAAATTAYQQAQAAAQSTSQALQAQQAAHNALQGPEATRLSTAQKLAAQAASQAADAAQQAANQAYQQAGQNLNTTSQTLQKAQQMALRTNKQASQASSTVQQAQGVATQANNQMQQALSALNADTAALTVANTALQQAQARLATDQQAILTQQALVASLQAPDATTQAKLKQMQSDPTQYNAVQYDLFTVGAGYLDLNAALNTAAPSASAPALSPVAYVDPVSGEVDATGDYGALCGNPALGGSSSSPLAGSAFCAASSLWNARALWDFSSNQLSGTRSVWGAQSIWGAQSVWGAALVSSDRTVWGAQ